MDGTLADHRPAAVADRACLERTVGELVDSSSVTVDAHGLATISIYVINTMGGRWKDPRGSLVLLEDCAWAIG